MSIKHTAIQVRRAKYNQSMDARTASKSARQFRRLVSTLGKDNRK